MSYKKYCRVCSAVFLAFVAKDVYCPACKIKMTTGKLVEPETIIKRDWRDLDQKFKD